jgi:hypothetical protein
MICELAARLIFPINIDVNAMYVPPEYRRIHGDVCDNREKFTPYVRQQQLPGISHRNL